ncbi:MAG: anthranilate phosphoribosyltransferase [Gemmatimonadetes bacterium]|nr:anthranilate phosphoribosyltransferase [Gemmatimonadota bacterium]
MPAEAVVAAIRKLAHGGTLSATESAGAFGDVMRGEATPAQVASLLTALRIKGEHADEVAGAARALREAMIRLPATDPDGLVDTCGTGGGAVTTFNISTAAAFVAAGAGVRIAKHGNRSFTSRSGSADVLEALGVRIDVTPEVMAAALESAGIVFMFAPLMHPAMRHVGPIRRELGIPTVMNIVGPLANPAGAGRQVVGVADPGRVSLIAGALQALGSIHALVVHGEPGLDEVSPLGPTKVTEVIKGKRKNWTIDPTAFGFGGVKLDDLAGGEPADNARIIEDVLGGGGPRGARAAVVLNAAAALYVGAKAKDFAQGVALATRAIDDGSARAALDRLKAATS